MPSHAYLFRAVNVGGQAKLPMGELRALATELGATEVASYIASGNLVCTPPGDSVHFERVLERAVAERFGFEREVTSRTRDELGDALARFPFDRARASAAFVVFLTVEPMNPEAAQGIRTGADEWSLAGREVFVRYEEGAGKATLQLATLLTRIGAIGTARNLTTVERLIGMLDPA